MFESRRAIFAALAATAGAFAIQPLLSAFPLPQGRTPQPIPSPNAPNPNFPPGLSGPDQSPPDKKKLDQQKQEEVKSDVEKLFSMVSELREQVQKTDASSTLSVSVVKKAQQIEKLAKQIKELAKG